MYRWVRGNKGQKFFPFGDIESYVSLFVMYSKEFLMLTQNPCSEYPATVTTNQICWNKLCTVTWTRLDEGSSLAAQKITWREKKTFKFFLLLWTKWWMLCSIKMHREEFFQWVLKQLVFRMFTDTYIIIVQRSKLHVLRNWNIEKCAVNYSMSFGTISFFKTQMQYKPLYIYVDNRFGVKRLLLIQMGRLHLIW